MGGDDWTLFLISSIENWAIAMMNRLHAVTMQLQSIQALQVHQIRLVMLWQAACSTAYAACTAGIACGLISLGLIGHSLLSSVVIQSSHMTLDNWDSLASNSPSEQSPEDHLANSQYIEQGELKWSCVPTAQ